MVAGCHIPRRWIKVGIHEKRLAAAGQILPRPGTLGRQPRLLQGNIVEGMIRVIDDHLGAVGSRRIGLIAVSIIGRYPISPAAEECSIGSVGPLNGHSHRMLFGLACLIGLDEVNQVDLPGRVLGTALVFIRDFIQHIVKIIHSVNNFADIGFLQRGYCREGE